MGAFDFAVGLAVGPKATIDGLGNTITELDGAVVGDPESGQGGSGIDFQTTRELREKAVVSGSFTLPPSDFLREGIETFTVAIPLKGNGDTSPASGAAFEPALGISSLLSAAGLVGSGVANVDGTGNPGWELVPASQVAGLSAKIFVGGSANPAVPCVAWQVDDLSCSALAIAQPPGEIGIATFTLAGTIFSFEELPQFPDFPAGPQRTTSAPTVESVAHQWNFVRSFADANLGIDNQAEDLPDSNSPGGVRTRQTGRVISHTVSNLIADDGDPSYEHSMLVNPGAPLHPMFWQVGAAQTGSEPALAYRVKLPKPEPNSLQFEQNGPDLGWNIEFGAKGEAVNEELRIWFL